MGEAATTPTPGAPSGGRTRRRRAGLTRWEVLVGLAVVYGLYVWWEPRIQLLILRSRRAEVGMVLDSLQAHLAAQPSRFEPSPRSADALTADAVPFTGGPRGWTPPVEHARGVYWTESSGDGVRLVGMCDVDGDGVPARYTTGVVGPIVRETGPEVF
jgi:hypothetical protein